MSELHLAWLTPQGRGALTSLAVLGQGAAALVEGYFRPATAGSLSQRPLRQVLFGSWSTTGEELVVCRISEERVEIHCHGGRAAGEAILTDLRSQATLLEPAAALNQEEPEPFAQQARQALMHATTRRTAAILLDQYHGALQREFHAIETLLESDPSGALQRIDRLLGWEQLGLHLVDPFRVVLCGRPNVGKSSLLNALLGFTRVIVDSTPGTTRDVVQATTAFEGWPVTLCDTAGLRETGDPLEADGIVRAEREIAQADLVLHVIDATTGPWSTPLSTWPISTISPSSQQLLTVINKIDLCPEPDALPPLPASAAAPPLKVSAQAGLGLAELIAAIAAQLVNRAPRPGEAVPFLPEHFAILRQWRHQATAC